MVTVGKYDINTDKIIFTTMEKFTDKFTDDVRYRIKIYLKDFGSLIIFMNNEYEAEESMRRIRRAMNPKIEC